MPDQTKSLRVRLKTATASGHNALESRYHFDKRVDRETCTRFLLDMARVYPLVDRALASSPDYRERVPDAPERSRLKALYHDLEVLGLERPLCVSIPLESLGALMGAAYVFEGSTMGGPVLTAQIEKHSPELLEAAHFIAGYGELTSERWRRFCLALDSPPLSPADQSDCIDTARRVFDELTSGPPTSPLSQRS